MADSNLRALPNPREPRARVVEHLRELLSLAEQGEIIAVTSAWERADGSCGFRVSVCNGSYPVKMIGELEIAKHAIVMGTLVGR